MFVNDPPPVKTRLIENVMLEPGAAFPNPETGVKTNCALCAEPVGADAIP
jgi:hypothetical protein